MTAAAGGTLGVERAPFGVGTVGRFAHGPSCVWGWVDVDQPAPGIDAGTAGLTATRLPLRTNARWLGAKRWFNRPLSSSRVTAKRSNAVAGRYSRTLD